MRRTLASAVLVLVWLVSGCMDEPRTRIVLRDISNAGGSQVLITLAAKPFVPLTGISLDLSTTVLPAATNSDIVLLDTASPPAETFYIYIGIDSNGDGQLNDSDRILPVPRVRVEPGTTVELEGIIVSDEASFLLDPINWGQNPGQGVLIIENQLSRGVNNDEPFYFVARTANNFSGAIVTTDQEGYLRISSPAVESVTVYILPDTDPHVCFFMNLDEGDTSPSYIPAVGDYANSAQPVGTFTNSLLTPEAPDRGELFADMNDYTLIQP